MRAATAQDAVPQLQPATFAHCHRPERRPRRAFDWSTAIMPLGGGRRRRGLLARRLRKFLAILSSDVSLFVDMLPKVLAGCLIGAFVTLLLPREMVARWVGTNPDCSGC